MRNCGMRKVKCGIQKCGNVCGAEWWVKCGMRNLDRNCRSENPVNLQIAVCLDASCAILMY